MAFGQSGNVNFNKNIQTLLDYFLKQRLMKQEYGMRGQLQQEQQAGYQALETTEHQNLMTRLAKQWEYNISQDDETNSLQSQIFMGRKEGRDTSPLEGLLERRLKSSGAAALNAVKGTPTESDMAEIMRLTPVIKNTIIGEAGSGMRQKEMIERVHEPSQVLQAMGMDQTEKNIILRGREISEKERGETGKLTDQEKARIAFVDDIEKRLIAEGIQPTKKGEFAVDFERGKILDPLSRENRGKALQWLSEIKWKLIEKEGSISRNEKKFLTTISNIAEIEPTLVEGPEVGPPRPPSAESGLISPVTGLRPGVSAETTTVPEATAPVVRKYIRDLRTNEEYWIVLRNGQWMRE